jgi:hypothetical protein
MDNIADVKTFIRGLEWHKNILFTLLYGAYYSDIRRVLAILAKNNKTEMLLTNCLQFVYLNYLDE